MNKKMLAIIVLIIIFSSTMALKQCLNLSCSKNQIKDCVLCQCIPLLNCSSRLPDLNDCSEIQCALNGSLCPQKCYCNNPSVLNNYCPSCFNNGYLNYSSNACQCICPPGYQGERCQFSLNPCLVPDKVECSKINCINASEEVFYGCQRKCLCCANQQCYNLGLLKTETKANYTSYCSCSCVNSNFSPDDDCLSPVNCIDNYFCASQFKVYPSDTRNCNNSFVGAQCPNTCGLCTPKTTTTTTTTSTSTTKKSTSTLTTSTSTSTTTTISTSTTKKSTSTLTTSTSTSTTTTTTTATTDEDEDVSNNTSSSTSSTLYLTTTTATTDEDEDVSNNTSSSTISTLYLTTTTATDEDVSAITSTFILTTTALVITKDCPILNCSSFNSFFDSSSCFCNCNPGYYGDTCENYDCFSEINDPIQCNGVDCNGVDSANYKLICPQTCSC